MRYLFLFICMLAMFPGFSQGEHDSVGYIIKLPITTQAKIIKLHRLGERDSPEKFSKSEGALIAAVKLSNDIGDTGLLSKSYHLLGDLYRRHSDYFKAISAYTNALDHETRDHPQIYLELGICYLRVTKLDSAKSILLKGLELNAGTDKRIEASLYNALGNVVKDQDDYRQALEYYLKSTAIFEQLGDRAGLTQSISNVGNIQYLLKNYSVAMDYAKESLRYAEEGGVESSVAYSNRLMGRIFRKEGKFDEALERYQKAIAIYQKLGARRDVSETHYNTGNIYYEKADFASAIKHYQSALAIQRSIPDYYNMAYSYSAIGQANYELQRFDNSLLYLDSAERIADTHQYPYIKLDVLDYKSMILAKKNRHREAYDKHVAFSQLKDSLSQEENRQAALELEAKYATRKKEEQIKTLKAETELVEMRSEKQAVQRNYLIGLVILSVALLAVVYNRYKLKNKTANQLRELDQLKSRFFTYLSHEFRTPLTLISGPLEQRLQKTSDPDEKADLQLMLRNSKRLNELINQLLDLAKVESGQMKLRLSCDDLEYTLRLIAASFRSLAEHRSISFHVDISAAGNAATFDKDKLEKILYNLLSNAFKFTPAGGAVWFDAHIEDMNLRVSVRDSGLGIPPEKISHVFNQFYQVDEASNRSSEGSGIGLALSKELAQLHKGSLTVSNSPTGGCEFVLLIPINRKAYPQTAFIPTAVSAGTHVTPPHSAYTLPKSTEEADSDSKPVILVVEDNEDMRDFVTQILATKYKVVATSNGEEALAKAVDLIPDLILTDVMMPEMDGMTLCGKIKTTPATNHIPVVMLTAKADSESKVEGLETGADDYLAKPFDGRELMVRIHNLIEQRKLLQEVFREKVIWQPKQLNLKGPEEAFMEQFIASLEKSYANPGFGVEQLCDEMALSRMQLHRKLKAITGKSPGDFLRSFRLERAKQMLANGMSVSETAYLVGFNNLSNFSKTFREHTGALPSEFAARNKAENSAAN
jgi:signal transduction histidine kinase/DNA-binding NarL/FixJ family response regulator